MKRADFYLLFLFATVLLFSVGCNKDEETVICDGVWKGTYSGWFTPTGGSPSDVSGLVEFSISGSVITGVLPVAGTGTLGHSGPLLVDVSDVRYGSWMAETGISIIPFQFRGYFTSNDIYNKTWSYTITGAGAGVGFGSWTATKQ